MPQYIPLENDLRRVVNNAPLIVFQIDKNGIFTLSEGKALEIIGLKPGQVVGQSIYDIYKDYPEIISSFQKVLRDGTDYQYVAMITGPLFFETKLTPVIQNGEIVGVNGVSTDISETRYLQSELEQSEERYRVLVESAPFGILVMQNAIIRYANIKFAEIFGYEDKSEIIDQPGINFLATSVRKKLLERTKNREKGMKEPKSYETLGMKKNGNIFPMKVHMEQITFMGKLAVMGFYQNISEQKKAEEQNQLMIKQLIHTQKLESLGILAGGIAHDFNNLLMGIMGYASLISDQIESDSPIFEYITKIEKSTKLASDLSRQMLNYSGKGQFQKEVISLKDLITDNIPLMKASISKSHELIFNLDNDLPLIEVDITQIGQVILNLITNASEAIEHSHGIIIVTLTKTSIATPETSLSYQTSLKPGDYLVFTVKDNGKGIKKNVLDKIFDPFFTTKTTGRGLGLAVVQGIINGHHGSIQVKSSNIGTEFKVLLPIKEGLYKESLKNTIRPINKEKKKGTILLCDDENIVVDVTSKMLEELGYKILIARDGVESIEIYNNNQNDIDMVILDLTMPKLSGEEVFLKIRDLNPRAKIILSSGYNEKDVMLKFSGIKLLSGFLHKPYRYQDLVNIINDLIQV